MHRSSMDATQTIASVWQRYNRKVYYSMPVEFGQELGKRIQLAVSSHIADQAH